MDIPSWFGITEFYAILATIWFGLIIYFATALVRAKFNLKSKIVGFRNWLKKRKIRKEEKFLGE